MGRSGGWLAGEERTKGLLDNINSIRLCPDTIFFVLVGKDHGAGCGGDQDGFVRWRELLLLKLVYYLEMISNNPTSEDVEKESMSFFL